MKNVTKYSIYLIGSMMICILGYIFLFAPWSGDTISTREITSGSFDLYKIGDEKKIILGKNAKRSFSSITKLNECPRNWIDISEMSDIEEKCLLASDKWSVGFVYEKVYEHRQDQHITLNFENNILSSVTVRCSLSI